MKRYGHEKQLKTQSALAPGCVCLPSGGAVGRLKESVHVQIASRVRIFSWSCGGAAGRLDGLHSRTAGRFTAVQPGHHARWRSRAPRRPAQPYRKISSAGGAWNPALSRPPGEPACTERRLAQLPYPALRPIRAREAVEVAVSGLAADTGTRSNRSCGIRPCGGRLRQHVTRNEVAVSCHGMAACRVAVSCHGMAACRVAVSCL